MSLQPSRSSLRHWSAITLGFALSFFVACGGDDGTPDEGGSGGNGNTGGSGTETGGSSPSDGGAPNSGGAGNSGGSDSMGSGGTDDEFSQCDTACSNFPCEEDYNRCNDDDECRNCMHLGEGCETMSEQRLSLLQLACDCRESTGCSGQCPHEEFCAYVDN